MIFRDKEAPEICLLSLHLFVFFNPCSFSDTFFSSITDLYVEFSVCDIATGRDGRKTHDISAFELAERSNEAMTKLSEAVAQNNRAIEHLVNHLGKMK